MGDYGDERVRGGRETPNSIDGDGDGAAVVERGERVIGEEEERPAGGLHPGDIIKSIE